MSLVWHSPWVSRKSEALWPEQLLDLSYDKRGARPGLQGRRCCKLHTRWIDQTLYLVLGKFESMPLNYGFVRLIKANEENPSVLLIVCVIYIFLKVKLLETFDWRGFEASSAFIQFLLAFIWVKCQHQAASMIQGEQHGCSQTSSLWGKRKI